MGDYLQSTNGTLQNDIREEWEKYFCNNLLSHNNWAERPFATLKALAKTYPPALSLRDLSCLTHSVVNGAPRPAQYIGKGADDGSPVVRKPGIALTADPILRAAVNKVCCVRRRKDADNNVFCVEAVAKMLKEVHDNDKLAAVEHRKRKKGEEVAAGFRKFQRALVSTKWTRLHYV
jgi:hypothetical protein